MATGADEISDPPEISGTPVAALSTAPVDDDLVSSLRMGVMRLARRLQLERRADDLTLTQLSVLGTLHRHGPLTIGELAGAERVKPPSMTRTVNHLEEAGLVRRCAHETDGRQVVVQLSDEARAVIAEDRRRRDGWLADHLRDFDDDQRSLLRDIVPLLERLAQQGDSTQSRP